MRAEPHRAACRRRVAGPAEDPGRDAGFAGAAASITPAEARPVSVARATVPVGDSTRTLSPPDRRTPRSGPKTAAAGRRRAPGTRTPSRRHRRLSVPASAHTSSSRAGGTEARAGGPGCGTVTTWPIRGSVEVAAPEAGEAVPEVAAAEPGAVARVRGGGVAADLRRRSHCRRLRQHRSPACAAAELDAAGERKRLRGACGGTASTIAAICARICADSFGVDQLSAPQPAASRCTAAVPDRLRPTRVL